MDSRNKATVSVVIPCYNHGAYLPDSIGSVQAQSHPDVEIIVVNDGSTDEQTNAICDNYQKNGVHVISTTNQGLAAARNNGIEQASGHYIVALDADDRIGPTYLEQAVAAFNAHPQLGIVYSKAWLFGAMDMQWNLPPFSMEQMMLDNIIFCSAVFKKEDWLLVGGYDVKMIYGWEDYDFWFGILSLGREVQQLSDFHFFYRIASNSMVRSKQKWQKVEMFKRIYQKHRDLIGKNIEAWLDILVGYHENYYETKLYVDTGKGLNEDESIVYKIDTGKNQLHFDLTPYNGICELRFDPIDCAVCLEINGIAFSTLNGQEYEYDPEQVKSNARFHQNSLFMFDNRDPHLFFSIPPEVMKKINRITIQMDINKTGDDALREIILFQNSITRNEADEAEQSAAAHPFWQHLRKSILSSKPGK
jgi:glycosyltransferase involved in cell wall biosynthesis